MIGVAINLWRRHSHNLCLRLDCHWLPAPVSLLTPPFNQRYFAFYPWILCSRFLPLSFHIEDTACVGDVFGRLENCSFSFFLDKMRLDVNFVVILRFVFLQLLQRL